MNKKLVEIKLTSDYITLGQFLKFVGLVDTGGEAKQFLASEKIIVNEIEDNRRGRKLYPGDEIKTKETAYKIN